MSFWLAWNIKRIELVIRIKIYETRVNFFIKNKITLPFHRRSVNKKVLKLLRSNVYGKCTTSYKHQDILLVVSTGKDAKKNFTLFIIVYLKR